MIDIPGYKILEELYFGEKAMYIELRKMVKQ